ncbi:cuticle protein-like [Cimex lectularius]|uniref:CPF family cuticle protein n=1 Tax=Cimex lectularius TaxID=79782 RepID=A0A8I6R8P5_CIMLE|nr:cuticle protein-like [Cimex lectularius]
MYKFFVLAAALACANAGYLGAPAAVGYAAAPVATYAHAAPVAYAPAAVTSQSSNTLRSFGNLGQVSTFHKTVDTPYSSVSKSDVRVSNPGYATYAAAPVGYAAPAVATYAHAAPAVATYAHAAPVVAKSYAAPVAHAGLLGVAYSAAPTVSHLAFDGFGAHYGWYKERVSFNMYKFFVLAAALACANAGYLGAPAAVGYAAAPVATYAHAAPVAYAPAAVTSQSSNTLRSFGNLGQVSTFHKTVDTPYSSVSKSDVRVSNPGYATYAAAPVGYAAPAVATYAHAAPAVATYAHAAPVVAKSYAAPVAHAGLLGVAYSAAPTVSHLAFDGFGAHYGW